MIILLENKDTRDTKIDIEHKQIDIFLGDNDCNKKLDLFLDNNSIFDKYDTIIVHENIYYEKIRNKLLKQLKEYCKKTNKKLVKFSGDNTQSSFSNNVLDMSAKSLYENIEIFLEEYEQQNNQPLILAYGKHWKQNIFLNILERLNILIEDSDENEEFYFDEFEDDYDLLKIKQVVDIDEYDSLFFNINIDDDINISQIKLLVQNLEQLIRENI